ncbi:hypothetical protein [Streptomyces sp. NPDC048639]|uniref:hypothetical protein n=1 Tax=Streptomyces sp. NPDC048639 TaxID=3365581 RepID=UPI0037149ADC
MSLRIRTAVPALLLASALTVSLSACNADEDNAGGKSDSTASSSQDGGSSSGKGEGEGTSGGVMDNSKPVAVPLPDGAKITSASDQEKEVLVLRFKPSGSPQDAADAYTQKFMKNGYESNQHAVLTRGEQQISVGEDVDAVQLAITYPDAAPPLPSEGELRSVTSQSDDTLTFTYGLPADATNSLSALKVYVGELSSSGWDTPVDGSTRATKGDQEIEFDIRDDKQLKVTVDVPLSVG